MKVNSPFFNFLHSLILLHKFFILPTCFSTSPTALWLSFAKVIKVRYGALPLVKSLLCFNSSLHTGGMEFSNSSFEVPSVSCVLNGVKFEPASERIIFLGVFALSFRRLRKIDSVERSGINAKSVYCTSGVYVTKIQCLDGDFLS